MREVLGREVDLLATRLRSFTPARYAAAVPPFGTRADTLWHLAQRLVDLAGEQRLVPPLPVAALPDVLSVVGHDLLDRRPSEPVLATALAEVLLHRYDVDSAAPGLVSATAALVVLEPGGPLSPEALLAAARRRCPAYG